MAITPYPVIFTKPPGKFYTAKTDKHSFELTTTPDALAGPFEDIPVHVECTSMDYEVPIPKDAP